MDSSAGAGDVWDHDGPAAVVEDGVADTGDDVFDALLAAIVAAVAADEAHRSRPAQTRHLSGWMSLARFKRIVRGMTVPLQPLGSDAAAPATVFLIADLLHNDPERFRDHTTLAPDDFLELLRDTKPFIEGPRRGGGMIRRTSARGRRARATAMERLYAALCRLRQRGNALPTPMLPYSGRSTPNADFWHVLGAVEAAYPNVIRWPDARRRSKLAAVPVGMEGCIGFVDATEIEIALPTSAGERSAHFSGKQGTVTISIQLICDVYGNIIDIEGPFPGSNNDINVWRASRIGSVAGTARDGEFFGPDQFILGDCGYSLCARVLIPFLDAEMQGTSTTPRARRIFSNVIRRYRAVVEYVFGLMKARWAMVAGPMTCRRHNVMLAVKAAAVLVQLQLNKAPLREQSWYDVEERVLTDRQGALFHDEPQDVEAPLPIRLLRIIDEDNPDMAILPTDDEDTVAAKAELQEVHNEITGRIAAAMSPWRPIASVRDVQEELRALGGSGGGGGGGSGGGGGGE